MTNPLTMRITPLALAALALSACVGNIGGGPMPGQMPGMLTVREVEWNSTHAMIGTPAAVIEEGAQLALFTDSAAMVFAEGVVAMNEMTPTGWREATTIPAADGTSGTWTVAIDGMGQLYRLSADRTLEPIADRYGLAGDDVHHVAPLGSTYVMFALANGFALSNGTQVTRYDDASYATNLAGGGARAAGVANGMVRLFQTSTGTSSSFPLPGARAAVFDASGRLLVATDRALYAENAMGALEPVFDGPVGAITRAGPRVWFTTGTELGLIDGSSISVTTGQHLAATVRLSGSPSGDVWMFDGPALHRYACDSCRAGADASWRANIQPIFTNYCAQCHRPGGIANIDLSTYESWTARRAAIRMRVTITRDMPPVGNPLPDADRMAIADWVASGM